MVDMEWLTDQPGDGNLYRKLDLGNLHGHDGRNMGVYVVA
jgi:hypothetical protein